jgi:hypothetical protein
VYFSPETRNAYTSEFLSSYQGVLILLMQAHREYQVVTPRTLASFRGPTLVLPDVRVLTEAERGAIASYVAAGGKLVVTGADATGMSQATRVTRFKECPGKAYMTALKSDFTKAMPSAQAEFLALLGASDNVRIEASPAIATHIAVVDGKTHIYFANFRGLKGGENAVPEVEKEARVTVRGKARGWFLSFLGEAKEMQGTSRDGMTEFTLPPIERGAVVWLEEAGK